MPLGNEGRDGNTELSYLEVWFRVQTRFFFRVSILKVIFLGEPAVHFPACFFGGLKIEGFSGLRAVIVFVFGTFLFLLYFIYSLGRL